MNSKLKLKERYFISGWGDVDNRPCHVSSEGAIVEALPNGQYRVVVDDWDETSSTETIIMSDGDFHATSIISPSETKLTPLTKTSLQPLIQELPASLAKGLDEVVIELESYHGQTLLVAHLDLVSSTVLTFKSEPLCHWYSHPLTLDFFEEADRDGDSYFDTEALLIRLQGVEPDDAIYEHPHFEPLFQDEN